MTAKVTAQKVFEKMYEKDKFTHWLGAKLIEMDEAYCKLEMEVRPDMVNGFDILHGGVTYSLADSAFAFASNSLGKLSVSIDTSMSYPASAKVGDILIAEAKSRNITNKTAQFDVEVHKTDGTLVGLFRGTVFRTEKSYF